MKNGDYILVVAPEEYPGKRYRDRYCYEHHLVYWCCYGTLPAKGEVIHHMDGDKHNNLIGNLLLTSITLHNRGHAREIEMVSLCCSSCSVKFDRQARIIRSKRSKGQIDFYCSRSCGAKAFGRGRPKINC